MAAEGRIAKDITINDLTKKFIYVSMERNMIKSFYILMDM